MANGPAAARERIGERLIRVGVLSDDQVKDVLIRQRESKEVDRLFGEIAVQLGYLDGPTLNSYLEDNDLLAD